MVTRNKAINTKTQQQTIKQSNIEKNTTRQTQKHPENVVDSLSTDNGH